ncbi:four helix bundle protein [Parasediminibacterium sp. JCM 36343]|uniref:four helix bundle protein n=1 Tax=Parasediminibacterium sp. JCM 36343 TaxID=3374279 RepID=UPI00397AAA1F
MRDYKKLDVWKKSHEMYIYIKKNIATKFPKEERYELTSQLLRAALSVPLNIVEGCGRFTNKDFAHFLDNSLGSANEADYCCFAAFECNYITIEEYNTANKLINEVRAMLLSFLKFLRNSNSANPPKP